MIRTAVSFPLVSYASLCSGLISQKDVSNAMKSHTLVDILDM